MKRQDGAKQRRRRPAGRSKKARRQQAAQRHADAAPEDSGVGVDGALPNLVVIGAMKCGSTSLHHYLNAHPQISMSAKKEINFFYRPGGWEKGVAWYRSHFHPEAPVRGESSVNYTKSPAASEVAAPRMHSLIAGAKLIYLVRNPIDRAISHYIHTHANGGESRSLAAALSDFESPYVSRGLYFTNLRPFLDYFPRSDLLVVPQEHLLQRRTATLSFIFSFVGVECDIDRPEFSTMWQTAASKLGSAAEGNLARGPISAASNELDPSLRAMLRRYFRGDVKRVRKLMPPEFGRDWRL